MPCKVLLHLASAVLIGSLNRTGTLHLWLAPSWAEINAAEAKEKTEIKQP